jgi:diguanylate cyclase (GGDEF)-like protein
MKTSEASAPRDKQSYGWTLPFVAVAVLGEASMFLPPGPQSPAGLTLNLGLFALCGVTMFFTLHGQMPRSLGVCLPLMYVGTVGSIVLTLGTAKTGVSILLFVSIAWAALYQRRSDSFLTLIAALIVLTVINVSNNNPAGVVVRSVLFWGLIGGLVSLATHDLKAKHNSVVAYQRQVAERIRTLNAANLAMTSILSSELVIQEACSWTTKLISPEGRASYSRIVGSTVSFASELDRENTTLESYPVSENPYLEEAVGTGDAVNVELDSRQFGPKLQQWVKEANFTRAMYMPIQVDGSIDGVLAIGLRGGSADEALFEQFKSIGSITQVALTNALHHESTQREAETDVMTGLLNRRGFQQLIARRPTNTSFAIVSIDMDSLKAANDTHGHAAGDEKIKSVADALHAVARRGDGIARVGGDEFAALLLESSVREAELFSQRLMKHLRETDGPTISIGISSGDHLADPGHIHQIADKAMYEAKRSGGNTMRSSETQSNEPGIEGRVILNASA